MESDRIHQSLIEKTAHEPTVPGGARVNGISLQGPVTVSIIIPVYNACEMTRTCLASIERHTGAYRWEVIIVDNASSDGTIGLLSTLPSNMRTIRNQANFGFARACNQGALEARGAYLLFLNNDTVVTEGWIEPLLDAVQRPKAGVVGCKLLYPDGRIQHAGISMINGIPDHPHRYAKADLPETCSLREMDMVTGACLMVPREIFMSLHGFDEIYRNGVEDVDLCLRVRQAGYQVLYQPETVIYHHEGQSAGRFNHASRNLAIFFKRWEGCFGDDGRFRTKPPLRWTTSQKSLMAKQRPRIVWEGTQFVHHSLALVNRELCLRLIGMGCEVSILPYESDQFRPADEPRFSLIAERVRKPLDGPVDTHIRHQWPPNFSPPPEGYWVIIQPWEFGSLPNDWIRPMSEDVDEIWVPSRYVHECYVKSGVPQEKVFVIPNGVNTDVFKPATGAYPLKSRKAFKFLFVGGTIARKGVDILLDAYTSTFCSSDDVCLVIKDMGGGSFYRGQTAKALIEQYRSTQDAPEIEYIETTFNEIEMAGLYCACDCLVHPYRGEGFGLPIAEAMACELPVIVTGYGAALDYCSPDNSYLLPAQTVRLNDKRIGAIKTVDYPWLAEPDRESLKALMKHVVECPAEAIAKAKAARAKMENEFTWDKAAKEILRRLDEIHLKPIARSRRLSETSKSPIEPTVSIVIRVSDPVDATKKCYQQIKRHTRIPHQIIFVANCPTPNTFKWLKQIAKENTGCSYLCDPKGRGWATENNRGIQASSGEFILLLDPHAAVVTDSWLPDLLECLRRDHRNGVVGVVSDHPGKSSISNAPILTCNEKLEAIATTFRERNRHRRIPVQRISSRCMLFKRELMDEIGCLDEIFDEGAAAAKDFCLRATLSGYQHVIAGDVYFHYTDNMPRGERRVEQTRQAANGRIFNGKWYSSDRHPGFGQKLLVHNILIQADEFLQQGQFEKAMASLVAAIKQSPGERQLYLKLAEMLIEQRRHSDALGILNAVPGSDSDAKQLSLLGYCEAALGSGRKAQEYAERALAVNPRMVLAMNVKGMVALGMGEVEMAEALFRMAIESDPGWGESYTNLGSLNWAAGDLMKALDLFERGFILSPTVGNVVAAYHSAVAETDSFARAEPVFHEARELHPNDKRISFLLIAILIQQKKHELAMREIEQAMMLFGIDGGILSPALDIRAKTGPHQVEVDGSNPVALSLCMIVKDEESHLAKCLMSVKPIVNEIIVVDTGSTDRTRNIAHAFGAKVFEFPWNEDFSAARNYSLSKASGDWILVLDADEAVSAVDHALLKKILNKKSNRRFAYNMITRNYTNQVASHGWTDNDGKYSQEEAGRGWVPSSKVRLFVNDQRIRFVNPVHELVEPALEKAGFNIKTCSIPVHHYGRLNIDKLAAKRDEYFQLGKKKIAKTKGDYHALKELAIQASELGKYHEAVEIWKRVIDLNALDAVAYMNMGYAYLMLDQYPEAAVFSKRALELDPDLREAALNYAGCELIAGDVKKAIHFLKKMLQKEPDYPPAMARIAAAYILDGPEEEGHGYLERLQNKGFDSASILREQARALISQGRSAQAALLIESAAETLDATRNTHVQSADRRRIGADSYSADGSMCSPGAA